MLPIEAAIGAMRWATAQPVAVDNVYEGAAGILLACAEARATGVDEFDPFGEELAARLRSSVGSGPVAASDDPELVANGLYTGLTGAAAALTAWAAASGRSDPVPGELAQALASASPRGEGWTPLRDVLMGDAGILLFLHQQAAPEDSLVATARSLREGARPVGAGLEWTLAEGSPLVMPNFSHGTSGIAFALARIGVACGADDLLDSARAGARRLLELGQRDDGTIAVPHSVPLMDPSEPISYGWCHGPAGTVRLFQLLEAAEPGAWTDAVDGCRRAVRESGVPARLRPGFWDNHGRCCGTAGVGEMALDAYQELGQGAWLEWAESLAENLAQWAIVDDHGVRWSNVEHRSEEPELRPEPGWMHGAAGIAAFLFRLERVRRDGADAVRVPFPDAAVLPPRRAGS